MSGFAGRKSSISPTRSMLGLGTMPHTNANKTKVDQALEERCNKSIEEVNRIRREFRSKEQEYEKKIALMKQEIELLNLQVRETEQREQQQR